MRIRLFTHLYLLEIFPRIGKFSVLRPRNKLLNYHKAKRTKIRGLSVCRGVSKTLGKFASRATYRDASINRDRLHPRPLLEYCRYKNPENFFHFLFDFPCFGSRRADETGHFYAVTPV